MGPVSDGGPAAITGLPCTVAAWVKGGCSLLDEAVWGMEPVAAVMLDDSTCVASAAAQDTCAHAPASAGALVGRPGAVRSLRHVVLHSGCHCCSQLAWRMPWGCAAGAGGGAGRRRGGGRCAARGARIHAQTAATRPSEAPPAGGTRRCAFAWPGALRTPCIRLRRILRHAGLPFPSDGGPTRAQPHCSQCLHLATLLQAPRRPRPWRGRMRRWLW